MTQLPLWLLASLLLVPVVVYLAIRVYRQVAARITSERRQAQHQSELYMATIEALALAIDAKEQTAHNHIGRVQIYATALARALGMSADEVLAVKIAALLHDVGKLAVPEHILAKPGPLTPEEFQKIRVHPQVGADIIAGIPFPSPVAPLILSHHERWDGRGYPSGLRGEEIPLGARILCLVDYFDALTSSRPYHSPMSIEATVAMIEQEAGKALDPTVVATFLRILPETRLEADKADSARRRLTLDTVPSEGAPMLGTPRAAVDMPATAFEHIAIAHREIYALYEIAQTMGTSLGVADTMAHIASKLSGLVPFSTCALFLYSDTNEMLYCRFASGVDAELIHQLAVKSGSGLSGWVARNRRPLVNARPSADLEAAGSDLPTSLQSALVCPLIYGDLSRRPPAAAGSGVRAGGGRHSQRGRVRADAGSVADRSADRTAERPLHVHAPDARAGAGATPVLGGLAHRHGPERLQGHQRHLRPPCGRSRAARGVEGVADRHPAV
jgi:putative nucleotidyltransferase with HDIG domain